LDEIPKENLIIFNDENNNNNNNNNKNNDNNDNNNNNNNNKSKNSLNGNEIRDRKVTFDIEDKKENKSNENIIV
jgi:hypothetical protein